MIKKIAYLLLGTAIPLVVHSFSAQYDLSGTVRLTSPTAGALEGKSEEIVIPPSENIFTKDLTTKIRTGTPGALESQELIFDGYFPGQVAFDGYYARYEEQLPSFDTCDRIFNDGQALSIIRDELNGDDSDDEFCFTPGDYRDLGEIAITADGTSSSDKHIIRLLGSDTTHPVNLAQSQQARIAGLEISGSNWLIHRITMDGSNKGSGDSIDFTATNNNDIILDHMLVENCYDSNYNCIRVRNITDLTIQNSVVRTTDWVPDVDFHCISTGYTVNNLKLVNNEIYNCAGDGLATNNSSTFNSSRIENNDIYVTNEMYCANGFQNPLAAQAASENALDFKGRTLNENNWHHILHNRFKGFRNTASSCGSTSSRGEVININNDKCDEEPSTCGEVGYYRIEANIFEDSPRFISYSNGIYHDLSVLSNIFYNLNDPTNTNPVGLNLDQGETSLIMYNTFVDVDPYVDFSQDSLEWKCNVVINSGAPYGIEYGMSNQFDANAYYSSTPIGEVTDPDPETNVICDGSAASGCATIDTKNNPLTFKWARWTSFNNPKVSVIPNIRATKDSPHFTHDNCGG